MLFLPILAIGGALATVVCATPAKVFDSTLVPRRGGGETCSNGTDAYVGCVKLCMKPFQDTIPQNIKCHAECKKQVCCANENENTYSDCELCKSSECDADKRNTIDGTADALTSRSNIVARVPTRCDNCKATFLMYVNKGDCRTAMNKMCNSYCKDECDYACACKIYNFPDIMPACFTSAGRQCVPH